MGRGEEGEGDPDSLDGVEDHPTLGAIAGAIAGETGQEVSSIEHGALVAALCQEVANEMEEDAGSEETPDPRLPRDTFWREQEQFIRTINQWIQGILGDAGIHIATYDRLPDGTVVSPLDNFELLMKFRYCVDIPLGQLPRYVQEVPESGVVVYNSLRSR